MYLFFNISNLGNIIFHEMKVINGLNYNFNKSHENVEKC